MNEQKDGQKDMSCMQGSILHKVQRTIAFNINRLLKIGYWLSLFGILAIMIPSGLVLLSGIGANNNAYGATPDVIHYMSGPSLHNMAGEEITSLQVGW